VSIDDRAALFQRLTDIPSAAEGVMLTDAQLIRETPAAWAWTSVSNGVPLLTLPLTPRGHV
jgi:hypothetical protein